MEQGIPIQLFYQPFVKKKVSFPIILKLYQKRRIIIHDTMKAGVYEVRQGMTIRQVMDMVANSENAQMNHILVIEGTTFKQLIEILKKDDLVTKEVLNPSARSNAESATEYFRLIILKVCLHRIPISMPKAETDKKILTDLYNPSNEIFRCPHGQIAPLTCLIKINEALIMAWLLKKRNQFSIVNLNAGFGCVCAPFKNGLRLRNRSHCYLWYGRELPR